MSSFNSGIFVLHRMYKTFLFTPLTVGRRIPHLRYFFKSIRNFFAFMSLQSILNYSTYSVCSCLQHRHLTVWHSTIPVGKNSNMNCSPVVAWETHPCFIWFSTHLSIFLFVSNFISDPFLLFFPSILIEFHIQRL